jgi:predicted transcriptional regulator of viral defense system
MKQKLGRLETQFFAYAQMRRLKVVKAGDLAASPLDLSEEQERRLLIRLAHAGMIVRVRRGAYLVPPRLPLGGTWSPDEVLALNALMEQCRGRYQICGPNAFNRYGFDEQVPNRLYASTSRLSGERRVGSVTLMLIKVADQRLGDTDTFQTPDGVPVVYASRTRALVDAVYDWSRFNGIPRGYEWIRRELKAKRVSAAELVRCTLRYGDTGTIRRMGLLLEREGVAETWLRRLARALPPTSSPIPWLPRAPKRGPINRRWGVVENDSN